MSVKQLGLKENWQQFSLLVLVNAFVGGMVGMERSILPELAETEFHLAAKTAILSFIVVFGITKALTNYFAGALANQYGRKKLLVIGWVFALPVPILLIYAPSWSWIIFANVFLGINQGLAWSSTVVMKIDLVGAKNRGFAMGINEAAGYLAVGAVAFLSASIANAYKKWIGQIDGLKRLDAVRLKEEYEASYNQMASSKPEWKKTSTIPTAPKSLWTTRMIPLRP